MITAKLLQGGSRPGVSNDKAVFDAILRGGMASHAMRLVLVFGSRQKVVFQELSFFKRACHADKFEQQGILSLRPRPVCADRWTTFLRLDHI